MSDRFGAQAMPTEAGGLNPKLSTFLAFAKAVLIAEVQAAWADAAPAEPNEIVNGIFAEDPMKCAFIDRDLPHLFAYEDGGSFEDLGDGFTRHTGKIRLKWLFPPAPRERKRPIDIITSALARTLAAKLADGRHPAYVHASDAADPDAFLTGVAAPTGGDAEYLPADFDGVRASGIFPERGRVLVSKTAGPWDTSKAIILTMGSRVEEVRFSSPTDAEEAECPWVVTSLDAVSVEEQIDASVTVRVGIALAPGCEHGSIVGRHMGVNRIRVKEWERKPLSIPRKDGANMVFDAVCFEVSFEETRDRSADALGYESIDDAAGGVGLQGKIVSIGGLTVDVESE
jgi:hypothetical protein